MARNLLLAGTARHFRLGGVAVLLSLGAAISPASAGSGPTNYSENPLAPSVVTIDSLGKFVFDGHIVGTQGVCDPTIGCKDYITINVPSGSVITRINLDQYNSTDDRAFIGVQAGTTFTANPSTGVGMLGYNHFGWRGLCATSYGALRPVPASSSNNCIDSGNTTPQSTPTNTNLFSNVYVNGSGNTGPSSPTFSGTLPAGDYTFWIQQVTGDSYYTFTVQTTVPTPGPLPALGAMAAFGWTRRLRRRVSSALSN